MSAAVLFLGAGASGCGAAGTPPNDAARRTVAADELADAASQASAPDAAPRAVESARGEPLDASVDATPSVVTDDDREQANAEKMAAEGKRGCAGRTRFIDSHGEVMSCYPYRCRAGACLKRCKTTNDCVPSAKPGESLFVKGWPILCGGHVPPRSNMTAECVPLSPQHVHAEQ